MIIANIDKKTGFGDSERCIEIPWAFSKYSGEQTVLDIGYANAEERYIQGLLSQKIPNLHGIDICEKNIEGIISHVGDIRNTNFEDNYFDLVFCISTIEHVGRDNSVYKTESSEDQDDGDFKSLKEIHRITKNKGKILLTVPFGKFFDYGWFIHYDENRLNKLLCSNSFETVEIEFFRYENGWQKCEKSELTNTLYNDNNAPAAAGLVCVLLEKIMEKPVSIQKETTNGLEGTMSDNTIEIRDDNINVEEIMATIRENIRRRQAAGELLPDPDSILVSSPINCSKTGFDDTFQSDLLYLHKNWDIHNNRYSIGSHHAIIGKLLVKGRNLVHGEVRRYVDPIISWQTEFNASTVRTITRTSQRCDELIHRQREMETAFSSFKHESDKTIVDYITIVRSEQAENLELMRHEFNVLMKKSSEKVRTDLDAEIDARARLAHVLEERIQKGQVQKSAPPASPLKEHTNYFLFEERFRGSRESITQRQLSFLQYFENCSHVLDIGCGRGEFLEILKNHKIGGIGVDNDPDMAAYCRSRQLVAEQSDAITYLETLEDESLDGIFMDQVVEHLEPDYLIRLLALCNQKMKFGSNIVIETVNPLSFVSFVNFYIDMTHKRPVHPETLQYLFSAVGFRECERKFFSPISDESRLKTIEAMADLNENEKMTIDVYNHNIGMLNSLLFGAQDYAIIGKK